MNKNKISQHEPEEYSAGIALERVKGKDIRDAFESGIQYTFIVPFSGESNIFRCTPVCYEQHDIPEIRGWVLSDSIFIQYLQDKPDLTEIKTFLDWELAQIENTLLLMAEDIKRFNNSFKKTIKSCINSRISKLTGSYDVAKELAFPLIQRQDVVLEYVSPRIKKTIQTYSPSKSSSALKDQQYEEILTTLGNMVMVMERSPNTFRHMGEEDIRTVFLVLLNAVYEGQATGETFNLEGKTDILIRFKGENIFIAECKFWSGSQAFSKAIDQLLDYKPWRDTKTAIILFNTSKSFSSVLKKIPEIVKQHPSFCREIEHASETDFRFVMNHPGDTEREFFMAVLAFDVPR